MSARVTAAIEHADAVRSKPWSPATWSGTARRRRFVIGDPQASAETFFAILDRNDLLADDGMLAADVALTSVGDHFDYGASDERRAAIESGLRVLAWLASHPPDQVSILLGNHDLGRVGELAGFDDATFARVHRAAAAAYRQGDVDRDAETALLAAHPALPTAELAARDFAAFSTAQRELVETLLRRGRLLVAVALGPATLACHAGITRDYLDALALAPSSWNDAERVASRLNSHLEAAVGKWTSGRLDIDRLHRSGDAATGEGTGMFYHRPAHPELEVNAGYEVTGTLRRRFDPRRLPVGLTQIVGHISDGKCRSLLGPWARGDVARPGHLRHLTTDGRDVRYSAGLPDDRRTERATMVFVDGGMSRVPSAEYQLLDLATLP